MERKIGTVSIVSDPQHMLKARQSYLEPLTHTIEAGLSSLDD
jgi:hypothetical protein